MNLWNRTNIFKEWTETTAYLLGLWYADGGIACYQDKRRAHSYQKVIAFYNCDTQTIGWVAEHLHVRPRPHKSKKSRTDCYRVRIQSVATFDYLFSLTDTTDKSHHCIPIPPVPPRLFRHFVRGFFDGDGTIGYKTYRNRHGKQTTAFYTAFAAGNQTGDFLERLRDAIREQTPVGFKKVAEGVSRKLGFNQYDSLLLCTWMYEGATVYMQRKKAVWDACDKERLASSVRWFSNKV